MAERIEVYGRVDGAVKFQYAKSFSADWGGTFTTLEIASWLNKLPALVKGGVLERASKFVAKDSLKTRAIRAGSIAETTNLGLWLERLEDCLLEIDSLMISTTVVKRLSVDRIIPSQLIDFMGEKRPSALVADALIRMGQNKWGVVKELTVALAEFESKPLPAGRRSVSVFITV